MNPPPPNLCGFEMAARPTVPCQLVGLDFLTTAPLIIVNEVECNSPPSAVFDAVVRADAWPQWFEGITSVVYTNPDHPLAVGSTRTAAMTDITVFETFLAFEQNRRYCFRFDLQSKRVFDAGIEDIQLLELPNNRTKITYRVALQPMVVIRMCNCLIGFDGKMRRTFGNGIRSLAQYVERSYVPPSPSTITPGNVSAANEERDDAATTTSNPIRADA